ncbi:MAG: YCF48-related protein [Aridibacter sp.]
MSAGMYLIFNNRVEVVNSSSWEILNEINYTTHAIPLSSIKFFDENNGLAVKALSIQKTNDGGKNWYEVFSDEKIGVYSGSFVNETEGWVVGTENFVEPIILKTTNKGSSWNKLIFDEKSLEKLKNNFTYFRDICFDKVGKPWVIGDGGIIQIKTNENKLELVDFYPIKKSLYRIACSESGDIWTVGIKNSVFHFNSDWVKYDLDSKYIFTNVKSFGSNIWLIGSDNSNNGVLLNSQDNGQNWTNKTPESAPVLNDIYIKDKIGWLIGEDGSIYYSNDGGNSWIKFRSPTNNNLLEVYFLNQNNGWISGDNYTLLRFQK